MSERLAHDGWIFIQCAVGFLRVGLLIGSHDFLECEMAGRSTKDRAIEAITRFYLDSSDFNGIPLGSLATSLKAKRPTLLRALRQLIDEEKVGALFSDVTSNTHVIRVGFEPKERQIEKIDTDEVHHTCLYPRPRHLEAVVDRSRYAREPYKLCMALGEPQLAHRSFDLSVLEVYRNDPRYHYKSNDISGYISVRDEWYGSDVMEEHHQVLLQTFGFSYDEGMNRAVAVFLRYLADLSAEHQLIWKAKELKGEYLLHPDYYRSSIEGEWGERVPICDALIKELYVVNKMAAAMGRPPLFKQDFGEYGEEKPKSFGLLIRPTLEEFNHFVLMLDKMLSDNLNKDFFQEEVPYETETVRKDGKIQVQPKGTLQILDDWLREYFRTRDWEPWDESIAALRSVRKLRQKPAHAIDENTFDQKYFKDQREILVKAYDAVRTLRMMLENHPAVRLSDIEVPEWLRQGLIWSQ